MSLHMSVILSTGDLCMMSLPVWLLGPMFLPRGGVFVPSPMFLLVVSLQGVSAKDTSWSHVPSEGSLSGRPLWTETPYSEERAVRILLECILVFKCNSKMICLLILVQTKCECLET